MDWKEAYEQKRMSSEDAIRRYVRSGDTIFAGGAAAIAEPLMKELAKQAKEDAFHNVILYGTSPMGDHGLDDPDIPTQNLWFRSFFCAVGDREVIKNGKGAYTPMQFGQFERYAEFVDPDVVILRVTPPDERGYCNIGPFGFFPSMIRRAERLIALVTPDLSRVKGTAHDYPVAMFDAFVEEPSPLRMMIDPPVTEIDEAIAGHILERVEDGACIQLGIGGTANAVGYGLREKKHLGLHTEMFTSCMVDLIESGAVDNSRKQIYPGLTTIGFIQPTPENYSFIDQNNALLFMPYEDLINVDLIAANDHVVSINSAISVDLTGQVSAESIGHRQFSGTGGQLDFVRGAARSKGGQSFIAISSQTMTKKGPVSKIVLNLAPGSTVTTPRTEVQFIVTEYGCADLRFADIPTRVKRLVGIAHPDYRDELMFEAKQNGLIW